MAKTDEVFAPAPGSLEDIARAPYVAELLDDEDITLDELREIFDRAPKAGLPAEWEEVLDATSGNTYFWNTRTSETTWERPGECIDDDGFIWLHDEVESLFED